MKLKFTKLDYKNTFKYILLFCLMIAFNNVATDIFPYSISIYATALSLYCSIVITPLLLLLSVLVSGETGLMSATSICALFLMLVTFIYRKTKTKMRYEIVFFCTLSLLGFVILGNTEKQVDFSSIVFSCLFTVLLTLLCFISGKALTTKGLKYK